MFEEEKEVDDFLVKDREIDFSFEDIDLDSEHEEDEITGDIEELITPEIVKGVMLGEKSVLEDKAVLIDLTQVSMLTEESLRALSYLVKPDGDMDIIIKVGDNQRGIGKGESLVLYDLIVQMTEQLFNKQAKVKFKRNGKFVAYNRLDTSIIRLKLM